MLRVGCQVKITKCSVDLLPHHGPDARDAQHIVAIERDDGVYLDGAFNFLDEPHLRLRSPILNSDRQVISWQQEHWAGKFVAMSLGESHALVSLGLVADIGTKCSVEMPLP